MGFIIDIILVAILLLSTFLGYKKGLVKLGAKLFAGIIAICNKASKGKINNFIQNMFKED